jgi:nucleoside-diphosphate-sugar epimerase
MTILVTGGGGFVGLNIVEELLARNERVVLFDRHGLPRLASSISSGHKLELSVITGDVRDTTSLRAIFQDYGIKRVVHTAVITADAAREARAPGEIVEVNVGGTINLLEAARSANCERVAYVSSGQAYGKTHDLGQALHEEVSPSRPEDVYAITKFAAESIALRLGTLWKMHVVCVRLGSVCGPWEFDTGVRGMLTPHLQVAQIALRGGTAIVPPKEVWRDWIYSRDVAKGLIKVLLAAAPHHTVYHLTSGIDWRGSFAAWCETLKRAYPTFSWRSAADGERPNVSFVLERDRAPMDIERIVKDVGFEPQFGPREAFEDYIRWIRGHEDFIRA